jgi:hypothetical protein
MKRSRIEMVGLIRFCFAYTLFVLVLLIFQLVPAIDIFFSDTPSDTGKSYLKSAKLNPGSIESGGKSLPVPN